MIHLLHFFENFIFISFIYLSFGYNALKNINFKFAMLFVIERDKDEIRTHIF